MGLLELGEIDCVVGGATTSTADLLRPSLQIVKASEKTITSFF
jgi:phosphotransacetylase